MKAEVTSKHRLHLPDPHKESNQSPVRCRQSHSSCLVVTDYTLWPSRWMLPNTFLSSAVGATSRASPYRTGNWRTCSHQAPYQPHLVLDSVSLMVILIFVLWCGVLRGHGPWAFKYIHIELNSPVCIQCIKLVLIWIYSIYFNYFFEFFFKLYHFE